MHNGDGIHGVGVHYGYGVHHEYGVPGFRNDIVLFQIKFVYNRVPVVALSTDQINDLVGSQRFFKRLIDFPSW